VSLDYVEIARQRVSDAVPVAVAAPEPAPTTRRKKSAPPVVVEEAEDFQSRARREGKAAQRLAEDFLGKAGFRIKDRNYRFPKTGVTVNFAALDDADQTWFFDVSGAFTSHRGGLLRTDTVWRSLGRANALKGRGLVEPIVFLTTDLPRRPSEGDTALRAAGPNAFFDAIEMTDDGLQRLKRYAEGGYTKKPLVGFWTEADLAPRSS
jgi:hypothetical protein